MPLGIDKVVKLCYNDYRICILHKFLEDVMDDGDGETCHSIKIARFCQA